MITEWRWPPSEAWRRDKHCENSLRVSVSDRVFNRLKGSFFPISHVKRINIRIGRSYSETVGVWSANMLSSRHLRFDPVLQCAHNKPCVGLIGKILIMPLFSSPPL